MKNFLREQRTTLIYDATKKEYIWVKHIIWASPLFIKILQEAEHIYIDATFITTKDYYQLLIIMAFNKLLDLKIPYIYALMNNKCEKAYDLVLTEISNLITLNDTIKIKVQSITSDFELGLINPYNFHLMKNSIYTY